MMPTETRFPREQIHPTVYLAPGGVVVGDVTIGEQSSVWFNAVVRGDCEAVRIGRRTNVQDLCMLHADPGVPCVVGDGVTIGHSAIVHAATIGDNTTVGMGSIVLNGARIGENSIVAAGAVVTPGTVVPPGSLVVGIPAKVKRPLTPEEIEHNRQSAEHYVEAAEEFMQAAKEK